MGNIKLLPTIIEQIDKYRKHCMWRGSDLNNMKPPLAAWSLVTVPGPKKMEVLVFLI
jgi:hypothetical protein